MKNTQVEVKKTRNLLTYAAVVIFAWGLFLNFFYPDLYNPIFIRGIISAFCIGMLLFTYRRPMTNRLSDTLLFSCVFVMLTNSAWILYKSHFHFIYIAGSVVLMLTAVAIIRRRLYVLILSGYYFLSNISVFFIETSSEHISLALGVAILTLSAGFFIYITRDNLEKKITQKDNTINEQQMALIHASRLTAMGEMAAGIAHEINNPLTIISGRVEQLQRLNELKQYSQSEIEEILNRMSDTVFRIKKLVTSMKSLSRNDENDPFDSYSVSSIVQETIDLCTDQIKWRGIQLNCEVPHGKFIECRPWQISQILLNLLYNSKDAIKSLDEKWIRIQVEFIDDKVAFRVADSGKGIPKEIAKKIMQPFFTTKETGSGTGLGLSISLGIAKAHSGTLVLNEDSPNTEFILTLPQKRSQI